MIVIGLMSGTSVDCIDAVVADITGAPPDLHVTEMAMNSHALAPDLRAAIFRIFRPETSSVDQVCTLNFAIAEEFATAAAEAAAEAGLDLQTQIDLIASHGQTAWHAVRADGTVDSTLQLGCGSVIAERTGVTTVSDFRTRDVAAGGQGAPLVSFSEYLLYRRPGLTRALQNIGGIANVTILPGDDRPPLAFDTGPGNMVIDFIARQVTDGRQTFDEDGRLAAAGQIHAGLLAELMAHPYLRLRPPKTTGREDFGDQYAARVWQRCRELELAGADAIATLTAFTAASIATAYRDFSPYQIDQAIVGGGGAYNPTLLGMLAKQLPGIALLRQEDLGFSSKAKEGLAFAIMGYEALHGRPGNMIIDFITR
ncbi:MAG TPA: anhydro-N-acetylmuramic acid kinase, partial [Anaerolineae bacterium]